MNLKIILKPLAVTATFLFAAAASAQVAPPGLFQLPLNQIPVPEPPNLFEFVKNKPAAVRLGKAFFWEMQTGSDGIQACATCHFEAGVDKRMQNTVNPGPGDTFQVKGPNDTLVSGDFPFHLRDNPDFKASVVLRDSNDAVGSQGVCRNDFTGIAMGIAADGGTTVPDPVFNAGGVNVRRVTGRNTPTNINAIFNFNNFWDGRAHFTFNGVNPFGPLDTTAGVWFQDVATNGAPTLVKRKIAIDLASLASQATGPPLDDTEMSFKGRTFPELGRKLMSLTPLGKQLVHPNDSVLGDYSNATLLPNGKMTGSRGLKVGYEQMIKDAFQDILTSTTMTVPLQATVGGVAQTIPFTQMEANFSLFWGLAIQLYEATLVADQTPFDRFLGGDDDAMTKEQLDGMNIFFGSGRCDLCHGATELTNASVSAAAFITNADHALIEQMTVASGRDIIYDNGFNNTAVRPTTDNLGRGADSPFDNFLTGQKIPLGFSMQAELQATGSLPFAAPILPGTIPSNFPIGNSGLFKVPGMRNVELTEPYFHNGDSLTLDQVVQFYTRGGNFPAANAADLDINIAEIGQLQNNASGQAALVAFMLSMTDERVRNHSAPFDHPELFVPVGDCNPAVDAMLHIPARDELGGIAPAIALTLDPVAPLTNKLSMTIGGAKEAGATVEITVNGGAVVAADEPTPTTWSAVISLTTGENSILITATDALANVVTVTGAVNVVLSDGSFSGGSAGIADAVRALRIAVGLISPTSEDLMHGDVAPLVNGIPAPDNRIGVDDALVILKKVVGLASF